MERRITKKVKVGNLYIGGDAPISIQSMTNTDTRDAEKTLEQIRSLRAAGVDIVRCAVPDMEAAEALKVITSNIDIPIVADIHFDYRLALRAIENGVAKLRVNPGNIGARWKLEEVAKAAKEKNIPIRVGVNSGSLEKDILNKYGSVKAEALVESALKSIEMLENVNFDDIVVSIKSANVKMMIESYRLFSEKSNYPVHLGVTEAGTPFRGTIKSSVGLGALLSEGIGDTLRVSLTGDPTEEVKVAIEVLKALEIRKGGLEFISCPTCGRTEIDLIGIANTVEKKLAAVNKDIKVAVMGCVVNGPGEAREADIGIAGGKGEGIIFRKGVIVKKCKEEELVDELMKEIEAL